MLKEENRGLPSFSPLFADSSPFLTLDERLSAIYEMVGKVKSVADIGADHGFLGVRLLLTDRCERVQFAEISEFSLKKAYRLAGRCGVLDRCSFLLGDGAAALEEKPEVAVIAGMGGETIAGIIRRGREVLSGAKLVLQPNVGAPLVREALCKAGYEIIDEKIVLAKNRHYVIIAATPGCSAYDRRECLVGPLLLKKGGAELLSYAKFRLRVARKAQAGAADRCPEAEARFLYEMEIWEGILRGDHHR